MNEILEGANTATAATSMAALVALWASRPGIHATPAQEAAWYEQKAGVHRQLAVLAPTAAETEQETAYAEQAAAHARRLLATVS